MPSIEATVKAQFEKVFKSSDWKLHQRIAEVNLREAALLRRSDMRADEDIQLLARNARKRLLIGVGVELLLKAVYLRHGYAINKRVGAGAAFPFKLDAAPAESLAKDQTVMLNDLVQKLPTVLELTNEPATMKGLRIAKVFRNKEGHCVTRSHAFDAQNYIDIATSLTLLYADGFAKGLTVRFAMAQGQRGAWQVV